MAGGCRLPKVIVVFALLLQINCVRFDDLLDRVRLSKSNEPEVQDFLRSVLKHQSDFKWIGDEARQNRDILHLHGPTSKNKRSFYSTNGAYPSPMRYGYKHLHDDEDSLNGDQKATHLESHNRPHPTSEDIDFEGPVNDIYPYEDNLNAPEDHRFIRETQDSFLYDDNPQRSDYNFLDEAGPGDFPSQVVGDTTESGGFLEDDRVPDLRRGVTTEQLLNHKMFLHRIMDKKERTEPDDLSRIGKQSQPWSIGNAMPGDAIEVIPSSMNGNQYAPGIKYEKYSEYGKNDDEDQYEEGKHKVFKRKCEDSLQDTDFKVPELFNNTKLDDSARAEFYYAIPHDILGINQDMSNEQKGPTNMTCKKLRRSVNWDQIIPKSKSKKKMKDIKIRIFDDDRMVKDIQKGDKGNSIVLRIRNPPLDQTYLTPSSIIHPVNLERDSESGSKYMNALNKYSKNLLQQSPSSFKSSRLGLDLESSSEEKDNTLEKIDSILKHDIASLKQKDLVNSISDAIAKHENAIDFLQPTRKTLAPSSDSPIGKQVGNSKLKGTVTNVKAFVDDDFGRTGTFNNKQVIQDDQIKQNRLEDQTEPTSAAEQRELGKLNNNYYTRPMSDEVTTDKILIIPLKKSNMSDKKIVQKKVPQRPALHQHRQRETEDEDPSMDQFIDEGMVEHKTRGVEEAIEKLKNDLVQHSYGVTRFPRINYKENLEAMEPEDTDIEKIKVSQSSQSITNEHRKRSNHDFKPKELITLRADAFRSRKLFSTEEDETIKDNDVSDIKNDDDSLTREVKNVKKLESLDSSVEDNTGEVINAKNSNDPNVSLTGDIENTENVVDNNDNQVDTNVSIRNTNDAKRIDNFSESESLTKDTRDIKGSIVASNTINDQNVLNTKVKVLTDLDDTVGQFNAEKNSQDNNDLINHTPHDDENSRNFRNINGIKSPQNTHLEDSFGQYDDFTANKDSGNLLENYDNQYIEDDEAEVHTSNQRPKKDIRRFLGMQNDEDYSEDRNDVYGADEKSKRKIEKKTKFRREKSKLGSLISSKEEKQAFRGRLAHTKPTKFKKDLTLENEYLKDGQDINRDEVNSFNYDNLDNNLDTSDTYQDLLDLEQDQDLEQYRLDSKNEEDNKSSKKLLPKKVIKHPDSSIKRDKEDKVHIDQLEHTTRLGDRCCENPPEKSNNTGKFDNDGDSCHGGGSPSKTPPDDDIGNELDIIERTQAILLHLTARPPSAGRKANSTNRGNIDENDDPENKIHVDGESTFKSPDNGKHTDNVVSEIIQLVQNYKDKVNEYKKNNHLEEGIPSSTKSSTMLTSTASTTLEDSNNLKKNGRQHIKQSAIRMTTPAFKILSDIDDDVGYHSHARMKAKKLHPVKESKCDIKEGKDIQMHDKNLKSDQAFIYPLVIREGFVKPEVVADIDQKEVQSRSDKSFKTNSNSEEPNKKEPRSDETAKDEGKSDQEEIKFDQNQIDIRSLQNQNEIHPDKKERDTSSDDLVKNLQKRNQREFDENPLSFTPDNLESFKEIVEAGKRKQRQQIIEDDNEDDERVTAGGLDARYKRDVEADYADDEINKLLSMVDDASAHAQTDKEQLSRYRRNKNFEPFYYETFPKLRQLSSEAGSTIKVDSTTSIGVGAGGSTIIGPRNAANQIANDKPMVCPIDECDSNTNEDVFEKKHKKKKKNKCEFADEYGDTSSGHTEARKLSKAQMSNEAKTRQRTKDKILRDNVIERQKEQEHIRNVLNGHLILDIMDKFQKKLKENTHLYDRFGQSLGKKCAADQVKFIDEFNNDQAKADVRHAQLMLHQVIVLMNKIVAEQVHRRTCLILSPTLRNYLKRIAVSKSNSPKSSIVAEGYPLPDLKENKTKKLQSPDDKQGDFLFPETLDEDNPQTPYEMAMIIKKKINIIRTLLKKYQHMSHSCQVHVEPVRDYLIRQLKTLQKLEKERKFEEDEGMCDTRMQASKDQSSMVSTTNAPGHLNNLVPTKRIGMDAKVSRSVDFDPYADVYKDEDPKNGFVSEKYKKLADAAANFRRKRQIEERLARLFGDKRGKRKNVESTTSRLAEKGKKEKMKVVEEDVEDQLRKVAFEAPMVYSLH